MQGKLNAPPVGSTGIHVKQQTLPPKLRHRLRQRQVGWHTSEKEEAVDTQSKRFNSKVLPKNPPAAAKNSESERQSGPQIVPEKWARFCCHPYTWSPFCAQKLGAKLGPPNPAVSCQKCHRWLPKIATGGEYPCKRRGRSETAKRVLQNTTTKKAIAGGRAARR